MSKNYRFIFEGVDYPIQISHNLIVKLGERISDELLNKEKYFIKSKVNNHNFQTFLKYLIGDITDISIDVNNYYDYFMLNDEFNNIKIISDILSKPEFVKIKEMSFLQNVISGNQNNKTLSEKYISENLDYFLEIYSEEMMNIPCTSLYNIFKYKNKSLYNQERAYHFISEIVSKSGDDQRYCILFETLDSSKISEESFKDSITKRDERFGFAPVLNYSFISSVNENLINIKSQFDQSLSLIIAQQKQLFNEMKQTFEQKINHIQDDIKNLTNNLNDIQNQVQNNKQDILEKIDETGNNIQQISRMCDETLNCVRQISNNNDEIHKYIQVKRDLEKNQYNEIIRQLTKECGGNVHDKGLVEVVASSVFDNEHLPKCAVDLDNKESRFASKNIENSWLMYDFKQRKVRPTHYSITSKACGKNDWHPRNWEIEGSNNMKNWKTLDSRRQVTVLNDKNIAHTFSIQEKLFNDEYYRYLRIRQIGFNVRNDPNNNANILAFSALEFFGSII